jgi:hypothetical protein
MGLDTLALASDFHTHELPGYHPSQSTKKACTTSMKGVTGH